MKKLCAVTGSNGYVGGCIKKFLSASGWDILELVRRPQSASCALKFELGESIAPAQLKGVRMLVHCAYDFKPLRWNEIRSINVSGSEKLLQAARSAALEKLVCISSISAYEGCRSLYGKAKLEMEHHARAQGALVIRPGLVWGEEPGGMFGKLKRQVEKSSLIPLIGDGSQIQYLVHHEDLCRFIERYAAGMTPPLPPMLTAANEQPWAFRDLLMAIARNQGKTVKFVPLPWRMIWLGLKMTELCGLRQNFRSDSLVSLMHQNPRPDFSPNAAAGLACRPFGNQK